MKLHELSDNPGSMKSKKRLGRGIGSGKGKTSGKGVKGQKARAGVAIKGFEGGQMPLHRRLPKRGFNNIFAKQYSEVTLGRLQVAIDAKKLDASATINAEALVKAGVVRHLKADGVRVIGGGGDFSAKITLEVAGGSAPAIAAVEAAGGKVVVAGAAA